LATWAFGALLSAVNDGAAAARPHHDSATRLGDPEFRLQACAFALAVGIFLFDLATPLGVADGVLYVGPVVLALWSRSRHLALGFATAGSILTGLGYLFSEPLGIPWMVVLNRGLSLAAIWAAALAVWWWRGHLDRATAGRQTLETALARTEAMLSGERAARQRLETDLGRVRRDAAMSGDARARLLAGLSHELRTPLNHIVGFSDIMAGELFGPQTNPRYRDYARAINDSAHDLLSNVDNVLVLASLATGSLDLSQEEVDAGHLLTAALDHVRGAAGHAGVTVRREVGPGLPYLSVDRFRLRQALANVLASAVRSAPPGGGVTAAVRRDTRGGIEFMVVGDGPGTSIDEATAAFAPFVGEADDLRADHSLRVGLHVARELVAAQGGMLALESRGDSGTTVVIRFPPAVMAREAAFKTSD
jgi:signal transduction histidine kinase